ncbi:restriction endonuclease subunit S [Vibrio cholerae]|nr:restriction endonuclease subunit S [Shewanella algae]EGR3950763.1 restriction endonuclease subunit S [Vibrio cholerae]BEI21763.1 restriction endonuclease subunit S [Vibrio fluvialis]EGR4264352.1 restriction endonuclease subunit S [Vibrio cholerae]EIJ0937790.1 restriction endonuclease subunit S [Vibrio cholerae]EJH4016506.1 restriction endonuclease subunit S [Vibrio cholerae]
MSNVRFMENLLDGVDVTWKPLGDVTEIKRGTSITKKNVVEGDVPVIAGGRTPAYYHNASNREGQTIVIAGSGAYAGFVSWWECPIFVSDAFTVKPMNILLPRYCYHFLLNMQQQLHDFKSGGGVPHVYPRDVAPILVPIPCPENPKKSLAIQAEIVRILDAFTAMTAELTAELNLRKKQYNYYRDLLLSFAEGEVEWKTLGWVGDVRMCKRILKNQTSDVGDIPFFKIGTFGKAPDAYISRDIFEEYKERYHYPRVGEVLISASGTIGRAVIFNGEDAYFQDSNIVWIENDESKVLNKYLFYFYQVANWNVSDGGVIKRLYNDNIKKTLIPIPFPSDPKRSLAEQARIVAILDKFDALTNSITEGLPREIELRQKQYEYYRDLLLSFPKPDAEVAA